jgi:hypothetical protein
MGEHKRRKASADVVREMMEAVMEGRVELRAVVAELTKRLVDEGKIVEAGWVTLRLQAISKDATETQLDHMRTAFFAGAQHVFKSICSILEQDEKATEADLRGHLLNIQAELGDFIAQYRLKHGPTEGKA